MRPSTVQYTVGSITPLVTSYCSAYIFSADTQRPALSSDAQSSAAGHLVKTQISAMLNQAWNLQCALHDSSDPQTEKWLASSSSIKNATVHRPGPPCTHPSNGEVRDQSLLSAPQLKRALIVAKHTIKHRARRDHVGCKSIHKLPVQRMVQVWCAGTARVSCEGATTVCMHLACSHARVVAGTIIIGSC
jgi:hypothetical protein